MSQLMGKEDTGLWSRQRIPERYFKLTVQTAEPAALVISVPALESASGTTMSFTVFPRTRPLGMDSAICFLWFCVWTVAAYSNSSLSKPLISYVPLLNVTGTCWFVSCLELLSRWTKGSQLSGLDSC